ncbi:MAG: HD domain-containing protein [Phycisphaerae bacterium]|nr:HD domain-containing protein [Phycisphaerae bacterium]
MSVMNEMRVFLRFLDTKDSYTREHSERVGRYAIEFAEFANLHIDIELLHTSAMLHDVGKLFVPLDIITKASRLTAEEFQQMQGHSRQGWGMLQQNKFFHQAADIIKYHHERWDGGGYPGRLRGEDIPLMSRIIHLVDAVDVMLTPRTYKKPYPIEWVVSELHRCSGTQFDPNLSPLIVDWVGARGVGLPRTTKAA